MPESNLPPGISGNEVEIEGPDETYLRLWCDSCDKITDQTVFSHPDIDPYRECEVCDLKIEMLGEDDE